MKLREAYRDYLCASAAPAEAEALARALAGRHDEVSELLVRYLNDGEGTYRLERGARAGQEVFVGWRPPHGPSAAGAVWLDLVDLQLSMLVPLYVDPGEREALSPEARERAVLDSTWFSLRPVARFQFGGFLDAARLERLCAEALDEVRIMSGSELDAVTSVRLGEVDLYLYWLGKAFASPHTWRSARAHLGAAPWSTPNREWTASGAIVSPEVLELDSDDEGPPPLASSAAPRDV
ncbi:MAG: hypothetical protein HOO96_02520, partial [Polyangiaceae bacterium]|nr:hypothetical protein [Polyangiaceae bacterium]